MRNNPLDGPGMGYGPAAGADRRGSPVVTVVLALVCLVLAGTLAFVLLRPTGGQTAAPVVTVTTTAAAPTSTAPAKRPASSAPASPPAARSATPPATPATSATPGGTDATLRGDEPEGVREAATTFLRGWLEPDKAKRVRLLRESATDGLRDQVADVDPAKIPEAKPVGRLAVPLASDYSAAADQKMSDGTTLRMELVFEPDSKHGWLVDTIGPRE